MDSAFFEPTMVNAPGPVAFEPHGSWGFPLEVQDSVSAEPAHLSAANLLRQQALMTPGLTLRLATAGCELFQQDDGGLPPSSGDTLQNYLEELKAEDPRHVFVVRRFNKLGSGFKAMLEAHFSQFGKVLKVLVAPSRVRVSKGQRIRPGNFGIIVMDRPEPVQEILKEGALHIIDGIVVEVGPFVASRKEPEELPPMTRLATGTAEGEAMAVQTSEATDTARRLHVSLGAISNACEKMLSEDWGSMTTTDAYQVFQSFHQCLKALDKRIDSFDSEVQGPASNSRDQTVATPENVSTASSSSSRGATLGAGAQPWQVSTASSSSSRGATPGSGAQPWQVSAASSSSSRGAMLGAEAQPWQVSTSSSSAGSLLAGVGAEVFTSASSMSSRGAKLGPEAQPWQVSQISGFHADAPEVAGDTNEVDEGTTCPDSRGLDATSTGMDEENSPTRETLRTYLEEISSQDPRCIFTVRRIKKLGFRSPEILRQHFSAYGEVVKVLVAVSLVKPVRDGRGRFRTRPGALGLVVMKNPESVEKILSQEEVEVSSHMVQVQAYKRPQGKEDMRDAPAFIAQDEPMQKGYVTGTTSAGSSTSSLSPDIADRESLGSH